MLTAIIVDDEDDAREALRLSVERYCPEVQVMAVCASPEEGIDAIKSLVPDLVFLDVQMPRLSGFDVLQQTSPLSSAVIFVSAYDKYAIKAIRFSALDYLLKPVDIDELIHAVRKVANQMDALATQHYYQSVLNNIQHHSGAILRLAVPSGEGIDLFNTEEIILCQAEGRYTTVHLINGRKKLISKTLKDFENILSESGFFRVHHSYLINLKHVQKYVKGEGGYVIMTEGHQADIARRKKEDFLSMLNKV